MRAWMLFLAAGAVIAALYLFVEPFAGSGPVMNVLGLAPCSPSPRACGSAGRARLAWACVALGFVLFWLGDVTYSYPLLLDKEVPFPSLGDGYLAVYPR